MPVAAIDVTAVAMADDASQFGVRPAHLRPSSSAAYIAAAQAQAAASAEAKQNKDGMGVYVVHAFDPDPVRPEEKQKPMPQCRSVVLSRAANSNLNV